MRVALLQTVGAGAPRIHVERAVLLLGPGVVVLERQIVLVREPEVELGERRPRVVGAGDRAEVVHELGVSGPQKRLERVELRARRPGLLLDVVVDLLVVRQEVEHPVTLERPSEREPELILREVGLELRDHASRGRVLRRARDLIELAEVVQRAPSLVRTGLRDHVHEAAGGAPELGVGSSRDDHQLLHRIEVEREGRPLPPTLLTEERVVEVRAVDRDVVVNPPLPRDGQLVAIRALDDRDVRREQGEIDEITSVIREARDGLGGQRRRRR